MIIDEKHQDGICVLALSGRLDMAATEDLRRSLKLFLDNQNCSVVFDFKQVSFVNSAGLGALVSAYKLLREKKLGMGLIGVKPEIGHLLSACHLDRLFVIGQSVGDILQVFSGEHKG